MQSQQMPSHAVGHTPAEHHDTALKFIAAGSAGEALAGGAAVALAILGLASVLPYLMVAIATICAGGAMFLEGTAIASQYNDLEQEINRTSTTHVALGGGMAFEVLGGIAGIALGILALVGVLPQTLVPVAAIAMGGSMLLGTGAVERLDKIRTHYYSQQEPAIHWAHASVLGAGGLQVLAGLGAGALGILALLGFLPLTLSLIAMLSLGGAVLLSGAAITGKMATAIRH